MIGGNLAFGIGWWGANNQDPAWENLVGKSYRKFLRWNLAAKSCGKFLRENLAGKSCRKFLWENLAEKSCGKILWRNLVGNSVGNAVGKSCGKSCGKSFNGCNGSKNGKNHQHRQFFICIHNWRLGLNYCLNLSLSYVLYVYFLIMLTKKSISPQFIDI